jgi:hypothetical protein
MHDGSTLPAKGASAMRIGNRSDAEQLVRGVLSTMAELEALLDTETGHVRVGRFREGLAQEARKNELSASYLNGLEAIKANAIAIARFAPEALDGLKAAHARFAGTVKTNQMVLATARAVSESLVKGIAEEMNRHARPQGYGPGSQPQLQQQRSTSEPLVLSRSL